MEVLIVLNKSDWTEKKASPYDQDDIGGKKHFLFFILSHSYRVKSNVLPV